MQNPGLPNEIAPRLTANGYSHALCRFYSTAVQNADFPDLSRVQRRAPIFETGIYRVSYAQETPTVQAILKKHYIDGDLKLVAELRATQLLGDYLLMVHPMHDARVGNRIVFLDILAGFIRIAFGALAIEDLHFEALYDLAANTSTSWTDTVANPSEIRFWEDAKKGFSGSKDVLRLKGRTAELAASAQTMTDPTVRFILYWLAIESEIGNGDARRRFANETLRSPRINDEINRLRKIRNDCLKEARKFNPSFFDTYSVALLAKAGGRRRRKSARSIAGTLRVRA